MIHTNYACGHSMYKSKVKNLDDSYFIEIPVPGFDKDELAIKVQENHLLISGKNEEYNFEKVFEINDRVNVENIAAQVNKGVLKIQLPKNAPATREITIN